MSAGSNLWSDSAITEAATLLSVGKDTQLLNAHLAVGASVNATFPLVVNNATGDAAFLASTSDSTTQWKKIFQVMAPNMVAAQRAQFAFGQQAASARSSEFAFWNETLDADCRMTFGFNSNAEMLSMTFDNRVVLNVSGTAGGLSVTGMKTTALAPNMYIDSTTGGITRSTAPVAGTVGTETYPIAMSSTLQSTNKALWSGRVMAVQDTIVNRLAIFCTQAGTGNMRAGILDAAGNVLAQSTTVVNAVAGVNVFTLAADYTMVSGTTYHLALQTLANGAIYWAFTSAAAAGTSPNIRARYSAGTVADPNLGMSSFTAVAASAIIPWIAAYRL